MGIKTEASQRRKVKFDKLVKDAKEADGNLKSAENKVAKAKADLNKAVKEKNAADKAYDEAKSIYQELLTHDSISDDFKARINDMLASISDAISEAK